MVYCDLHTSERFCMEREGFGRISIPKDILVIKVSPQYFFFKFFVTKKDTKKTSVIPIMEKTSRRNFMSNEW